MRWWGCVVPCQWCACVNSQGIADAVRVCFSCRDAALERRRVFEKLRSPSRNSSDSSLNRSRTVVGRSTTGPLSPASPSVADTASPSGSAQTITSPDTADSSCPPQPQRAHSTPESKGSHVDLSHTSPNSARSAIQSTPSPPLPRRPLRGVSGAGRLTDRSRSKTTACSKKKILQLMGGDSAPVPPPRPESPMDGEIASSRYFAGRWPTSLSV